MARSANPVSDDLLDRMHRYWMAANYLTVGQIYLRENPLLRSPLEPAHIKPRLLGHWGTSPGLNLLYVHVNRLIRERDASFIYLAGPGHGGPAIVGNVYLEGTYTEISRISRATLTACGSCSGNSRRRAASPVTSA
jgi:xylulose-5-phosphate/fructose-6-phosphate phosphoketolase